MNKLSFKKIFKEKTKTRFKIHKVYETNKLIELVTWYSKPIQIFPTSYVIHLREDLLKDKEKLKTLLLHEIGHMWYIHKNSDLKDEIQADCFALEFGANIDIMLNCFNPNDENYYGKYQFEPLIRRAFLILKKQTLGVD